MHLRRAALATTAVTLGLLAPVSSQAAPAATPLNASYTCQVKSFLLPDAEPFAMEVAATVDAVRTGPRVDLAVSMGRPVLAVDDTLENVQLASSLKASVNGAATTLAGSGTVTLGPGRPVDLPLLTGALTTPATSLTVVPGALTVTVTVGPFEVPINCTPVTAPSVTVPVVDPSAPPAPAPAPAPAPTEKSAPSLKVSLTKKTQKLKKAPATVKIALGRATGSSADPAGTITVKVGNRKIATRTVAGSRTLKIALPRTLKPGRHVVRVSFSPRSGTPYKQASRTVRIRVTR